jgi:hypothetical protein
MEGRHPVNLRGVYIDALLEQRANARAILLLNGICQRRPGAGRVTGCGQQQRQSYCARVIRFHDFLNRPWTPMEANNGLRRF